MHTPPIFRLAGGVISLVVVVLVGLFVIKPALQTGNDAASKAVSSAIGSAGVPTESDANPLEPGEFGKIMKEIEAQNPKSDELLETVVTPDVVNVTYRKASSDSAFGYSWIKSTGKIEPVEVKISGTGSLDQQVIPASELDTNAPAKINAAVVKKAGDDAKVTSTTFKISQIDGKPAWVGGYETGTRTSLSFTANPDGSGVKLSS